MVYNNKGEQSITCPQFYIKTQLIDLIGQQNAQIFLEKLFKRKVS